MARRVMLVPSSSEGLFRRQGGCSKNSNRLAGDQPQTDAATATPHCLLSQDGVGTGPHEIELTNVDYERTRRDRDAGAPAHQALPDALVTGIDVTVDVNNHRRAGALGDRPQTGLRVTTLQLSRVFEGPGDGLIATVLIFCNIPSSSAVRPGSQSYRRWFLIHGVGKDMSNRALTTGMSQTQIWRSLVNHLRHVDHGRR